MKLAGAVLIIFSGIIMGLNTVGRYKHQIVILKEVYSLLLNFKANMGFSAMSLEELIFSSKGKFARSIAEKIKLGQAPPMAWQESSTEYFTDDRDKYLLNSFINDFGKVDIMGQSEKIDMYLTSLSKRIEESEESYKNKSKTTFAAFFFSGAVLAIFLV